MENYNPAKFEDVVEFMGLVNKSVYGINPFKAEDPDEGDKEELEVLGDLENDLQVEEDLAK